MGAATALAAYEIYVLRTPDGYEASGAGLFSLSSAGAQDAALSLARHLLGPALRGVQEVDPGVNRFARKFIAWGAQA